MSDLRPVRYAQQDAVALIAIDNPPVNALGYEVRRGLIAALDRAEAQKDVSVAVLWGAGPNFIAGADIREFGQPPRDPSLPELCARLEASPLLVVSVLHGMTLGGGLEIALSTDYRIAIAGSQFGFPEVNLGLIPGAGGTQRLPRLTGVDAALDLITRGRRISDAKAHSLGIVDQISKGAPETVALSCARELLTQNQPLRPLRDAVPPAPLDWDAAQAAVKKRARGQIAPVQALNAIRASAEMPFDQGMSEERRIFKGLMRGAQRQAMVHAFFAERQAARVPEIKGIKPRDIQSVGIVGGGLMGAGIASAALLAGLPVVLVETSDAAAESARDRIAQNLEGAVHRGKMTSAAYEMALGRALELSSQYDALSDCDLIIEAVFEDMAVKQAVFEQLDRYCKADAVLATNTSYLDITEIAQAIAGRRDVLGLHFFSPAHVMTLLEIVVPDGTGSDVVATGFDFAKRLGKQAVRAGVGDGFIGNRILQTYRAAAHQIVLAGASPAEVDAAMERFGFAMGPYTVADLAGLDIGMSARKRHARLADFPDRLCQAGHLGRKTGAGYYLYEDGTSAAGPNPKVLELIEQERQSRQMTTQPLSPDQISDRIVAAMANEAARVIAQGIARRPLDVDVVMMAGYGFPRHHGGPCKWADLKGLSALLSDIKYFAKQDPDFWQPAALLQKLVAEGRNFDELNRQ